LWKTPAPSLHGPAQSGTGLRKCQTPLMSMLLPTFRQTVFARHIGNYLRRMDILAMPEVSVIIPCYNQGQYLHEAIDSVLAQTFTDLEIIVVDDGSTDPATREILDTLNRTNTWLLRRKNGGLAAARNSGISTASGRYILPLDCDDRILNPIRCAGLCTAGRKSSEANRESGGSPPSADAACVWAT
jgi:hypothetical protein